MVRWCGGRVLRNGAARGGAATALYSLYEYALKFPVEISGVLPAPLDFPTFFLQLGSPAIF